MVRRLQAEHGTLGPTKTDEAGADFDLDDFTGETREVVAAQRVKQGFFRRAILSSYHERCCISGVTEPSLLVASHIVPWSEDKSNRLNPANGLCLSAIHDKAFDSYLFSLTDDFRVILSERLRATKDAFLKAVFLPADDKPIEMPERFVPEIALVARHRDRMLGRIS